MSRFPLLLLAQPLLLLLIRQVVRDGALRARPQ